MKNKFHYLFLYKKLAENYSVEYDFLKVNKILTSFKDEKLKRNSNFWLSFATKNL